MKGFSFSTAPRIISELGSSAMVGNITRHLGCRNIGIVTDKGVRSSQLLDTAVQSLGTAGVGWHVFDGVVADPPLTVVVEAIDWAKEARLDGIVGFGGGSPLDVAKLVAFLCGGTTQTIDDIWGVDMCVGKRLPLVQVPTTAGTGSEVTPISIITTGESQKKGVVAGQLLPDVAVCDGALTFSVPRNVTAYTGIDAMVHCIEAYTSAIKKNPLSDMLAIEALRNLGGNIRAACTDGSDREARQRMLYGSTLAGMAFANAPVGGVHALAYPVGANFKVPHGLSNALMLPPVLRFNGGEPAAEAAYGELLGPTFPELWGSTGRGPRAESCAEALARGFEQLAVDLDVETRLTQVGISEADIATLTSEAMQQTRLLPNNPRAMCTSDVAALYMEAL